MRLPLIIVVILAVFGLVVGGYYLGAKQTPTTSIPVATAPTTTRSSPTVETSPTDPNLKIFTSADLGISFSYLENQNGDMFGTKQIANKVIVYNLKYPIDQGQYVEVFSKNKTDDLQKAIERKFLPSYPPQDCFVKIITNPISGQPTQANFTLAVIGFPQPATDDLEAMFESAKKCPMPYTATNGAAYFAADSTHPDKFVFFSIGQYGIAGGPNDLLWQSTLKFL